MNEQPMDRGEYLNNKLRRAIASKIKREEWSQSEAGKLCGMSRIHMNHLVNGTQNWALDSLARIAQKLGLRVDLLIEDPSEEGMKK